jgi:Bacteriophage lambda head decoration protein D
MSLGVFKATRAVQVSDLVKRELDPELSRASFTLLAGSGAARSVKLGTPLGMIVVGGALSAAQAAVAGNTGNGTLALANPALDASAKAGVYSVVCTTGGADGTSKFRVEDPDGVVVGTATGGAAFNKAIKFTISGGGAAFVIGDSFNVTLTRAAGANDGKVKEWDPAATDGSQKIWGLSIREITAADGVDNTNGGVAIRRLAVVRAAAIDWPDGATSAQKAAALADIDERLSLIARG